MIAGLPTNDQLTLTVGDLDTEHLTVLTADGVRQLPEQAGPTLKAMAASRAAAGATSDEPLLARPDGGEVTDRALADAINAVQGETGLRLTPDHVRRAAEPLDAWARRRLHHGRTGGLTCSTPT